VTERRPPIVEVKRRLDGREQRFDCELVHRGATQVIVLYRVRDSGGGRWPAPLDSYGCFWPRRTYSCYYMVDPATDRFVLARFDVVRDVEVLAAEVRYTDLMLDLWVESGGAARWEDEAEVEDALHAGALTAADGGYIRRARATLEQGHERVLREIRWQLERLGAIADEG
jgi:hypothetical protein